MMCVECLAPSKRSSNGGGVLLLFTVSSSVRSGLAVREERDTQKGRKL